MVSRMSAPPANTRAPSERHRFDATRLSEWMQSQKLTPSGPLTVRQFRGGQSNPTFWVSDGDKGLVLRKKPPGKLLPSAHAVDREHRVLSALAATEVPVAQVYAYCGDPDVIGTPFYLMEHVEGRIFWNVQLPEVAEPAERSAIYDEAIRVLAAIHSVDLEATGLSDFGPAGGYVERQIRRWSGQYRKSETHTCLLYTSPSPRDATLSRMPSSA